MANNSTKKHRKRKNNKSLFPILVIIAIIIGGLVAFKAFTMVYSFVMNDNSGEVVEDENQFSANDMIDQVQSNLIGSDIDGVIKDIDDTTKKITFYNLKSNETIILATTDKTVYPALSDFGDLKIGDVVTFVYDEERQLTDIKTCQSAWQYSDVGLIVNTDAKLVKFGEGAKEYMDKSYKYTEGITTVRYKDEYTDMDKISPLDYVTIRGYDNGRESKVYSITIDKGHGELVLNNFNRIDEGKLKFDDEPEIDLPEKGVMTALEGNYSITVTGSNCEPFTASVTISPLKTSTLDLSKVQIKQGLLNVTANVTDYTITIEDTKYPANEPILLDYGTYEVIISKTDYDEYKGSVTINQDTNSLAATLKESTKYGNVSVTANPGSAKVYIDGALLGVSPQTKQLPLGSHTINVKLDGYIEESRTINIANEGDTVSENFDLTPLVSAYVTTD